MALGFSAPALAATVSMAVVQDRVAVLRGERAVVSPVDSQEQAVQVGSLDAG